MSSGRCVILLCMAALLAACTHWPERRDGYRVDHQYPATAYSSRIYHLVLHYTSSEEPRALRSLTGPEVSSHYLVPVPPRGETRPVIYQMVPEHERAWHAGVSAWGSRSNINDTSIGIEIINTGPRAAEGGVAWAPYPPEQINAVIALVRDLVRRYDIDPINIVGHSDVAPLRKVDPGPAFPWKALYDAGLGVWPEERVVQRYRDWFTLLPPTLSDVQEALATFGYPIRLTGEPDRQTCSTLQAFQMRFRPADYRGVPDAETVAILWALLERYRPALLPPLAEWDTGGPPSWAGWNVTCPVMRDTGHG